MHADRVVSTRGAVEKHVANVFAKLGLPVSESDNGGEAMGQACASARLSSYFFAIASTSSRY
jgi:hypothetical protein